MNANLALQLGYNYQQRYYADFGAALIHSAKLAKGAWSASPSLTLGWRLSGENFLKDSPVVDDLLFSVSGSILNQDIDLVMGDKEFYLYESVWTQMMATHGMMVRLVSILFLLEGRIMTFHS